jgi:hypothetical protein
LGFRNKNEIGLRWLPRTPSLVDLAGVNDDPKATMSYSFGRKARLKMLARTNPLDYVATCPNVMKNYVGN